MSIAHHRLTRLPPDYRKTSDDKAAEDANQVSPTKLTLYIPPPLFFFIQTVSTNILLTLLGPNKSSLPAGCPLPPLNESAMPTPPTCRPHLPLLARGSVVTMTTLLRRSHVTTIVRAPKRAARAAARMSVDPTKMAAVPATMTTPAMPRPSQPGSTPPT